MATANPSRTTIPEENVCSGASAKSRNSAKSRIESMLLVTTSLRMPISAPFRKMLSRVLRRSSKPAPSSSKPTRRPCLTTVPVVGTVTPEMTLRRVDLPEPFAPMIPRVAPLGTVKETPSRARRGGRRLPRSKSNADASRRRLPPDSEYSLLTESSTSALLGICGMAILPHGFEAKRPK